MAYIEMNGICKTYRMGEVDIAALSNTSFEIERGEFVCILGPSGAGKTTCLNILGGMDSATSGSLIVDGTEITSLNSKQLIRYRRQDIGFVFQFYNLIQNLTALENVELAVQLCSDHLDPAEILKKVGLEDRMNNYPHQLSGGQQQRVAIARALALKPDILCFDEPTSALDPELTGEVLKVIKELADQHTTMIIVTHEIGFARDVSDEIIFMDNGVIADKGTPSQLIDNPSNERTRQFLANYLK